MLRHSLTLSATMIVRLYLWVNLQKYMGEEWKPLPGGAPPIIPVQEQPEIQESGNPYMVYIYDTNATTDLFQLQYETLTLWMFSQSPAIIAATGKLCTRLFNRWDESARDLNAWVQSPDGLEAYYGNNKTWVDEARNIQFKSVTVAGIQGAQPAEEEGGRVDSIITIDMSYVEAIPTEDGFTAWSELPDLGLGDDNT